MTDTHAKKVTLQEAEEFAEVYNDHKNFPTIAIIGKFLMIAEQTVRNRATLYRKAAAVDKRYPVLEKRPIEKPNAEADINVGAGMANIGTEEDPVYVDVAPPESVEEIILASKESTAPESEVVEVISPGESEVIHSETFTRIEPRFTKEHMLEVLTDCHKANGFKISKHMLHDQTEIEEEDWMAEFGTFSAYKMSAGLVASRAVRRSATQLAQHVNSDHYRGLNVERSKLHSVYDKPTGGKYQTVLVIGDIHDVECDQFYLRVMLDTAKRIQPDIICINGDALDLPEFGKYDVDPREWDAVGRIKFLHEKVLAPLRESCPDAQIDYVEGNHEARLLIHLADATPALRSILSDLHGFTVSTLLGLDKYEINYLAKADLQARSKSEINKEVGKNYKVYNNQFMCHHFPAGRHMGLPGVNGHHHSHLVWSEYSHDIGSYSWHQSGCGHVKDASYCAGEKWDLGFLIAIMNTETRITTVDYIEVGESHAVSSGKIYEREPSELLPFDLE